MQASNLLSEPHRRLRLIAFALGVAFTFPAAAQNLGTCGSLNNAFGPFDYRKERGNNLYLVESAHFTPVVEALIRSVTGNIGADIDYTLRAFPNHHKALVSMMRLGERLKARQVPRANWEVECYFVRAAAFAPDDVVVRMLYAGYLNKQKMVDKAMHQLAMAEQHAGDNPFTHYNLGLSYFELASYDKALIQAHRALALGFPRTDLKERLVALNKWAEPEPAADAAASAPAASAASAPQ